MKKLTLEEFIRRAKLIHGDKYDYSKVVYLGIFIKVIIVCPEHGEFEQTPHNHLFGKGCYKCKNEFIGNLKRSNLEEFIFKSINIHNNRYGYKNFIYTDSSTKSYVTCEDHGDFLVSPNNHLRGKGCPICNIERLIINHPNKLSLKEFIQKARLIHGNKYGYNNFIYKNAKTKGIVKCNICNNIFKQNPNNHLQGQGCPICNSSKGEIAIKAILDKHGIESEQEWKFPNEKYLFEYDFYLPKLNILIEFHGIQHYEWIPYFHKTHGKFEEQRMRDKNKIILAKEKNIPLIEFNYKQLEKLSREQFEELVINKIKFLT